MRWAEDTGAARGKEPAEPTSASTATGPSPGITSSTTISQPTGKTVQWVKNAAGKPIAVVNGYSFNLNATGRRYWRCSRAGSCKANFSVDGNWTITRHNLVHDHQPSKYIIRNGVYIRI
ncbi:FLYWCH zinc finger domain-containing protein [Phthorimaea operculella]|nr:FLYWCH zinc finger domain-containing protein [Phthorimaea operculella]